MFDEDVNLDVDKVKVVGIINDSAEVGSPDGRPIDVAVEVPRTAFNRWSLDATGTGWAVVGTVARDPGTLTLPVLP